jgi:putative ABC transport system permease protein
VLGQTVIDNLFGEEDPVGKTIRVNTLPCKVIGTLAPKGASATGQDQDDFVMMPFTTVQKRITGTYWLDDIYCSAVTRENIPEIQRQIIGLLRDRHHLGEREEDDFNIRSPEDLIRAQLAAANVFMLLLAATASLSLLVGGIGIMNIMLVSVTERTREIGIRLAVGATEADIRLQFLSEAVVMSVLGGCFGVPAGYGGALIVEQTLHWQVEITTTVVLTGAQLNPIEALRYE